ncbi:MAG: hypothetical protein Kow0059_13970 [Candidatus Sumerlaeia bacterium]
MNPEKGKATAGCSAGDETADAPAAPQTKYFRITVVDRATGRGVPLVRLTALNGLAHWTDSAGVIAFFEPGLMGREVWFSIDSDGYGVAPDAFGNRGVRLHVEPGARARVEVERRQIAQRLYRLTGAGIYLDSVLLGDHPPIREPLLNAGVAGQDSVLVAPYRGRLFWIWGDTTNLSYPLAANFKVTGATSALPNVVQSPAAAAGVYETAAAQPPDNESHDAVPAESESGMPLSAPEAAASKQPGVADPEVGVDFEYFKRGDFVKPLAPFDSPGPVWLSSLLVLPDGSGRERLLATYHLIKPQMTKTGRGLAQWNDEREEFEILAHRSLSDVIQPDGHPFRVREGTTEFIVFPSDTRMTRCRAEYAALLDISGFEGWTCLREGERFDPDSPASAALDRGPDGRLRWAWRRATAPIGQHQQESLVRAGLITPAERWFHLLDPATARPVLYHAGSIYWNDWRRRWTMVFTEFWGTSALGEVWYAEADTPLGPWGYAVKIATHKKYSFYNPVQHPEMARDGGRIVYFEGTYATTFSGAETPTPRYDYNQIMYRLELDDPRLVLPQPVYFVAEAAPHYRFGPDLPARAGRPARGRSPEAHREAEPDASESGREASGMAPAGPMWPIVFFALDRPREGAIPIFEIHRSGSRTSELSLTPGPSGETTGTDRGDDPGDVTASPQPRPAFYALPSDSGEATSGTLPLTPRVHAETGERIYVLSPEDAPPEFTSAFSDFEPAPGTRPLCRVWRPPVFFNPFSRRAP